jgi:hypothetical protein
MSLEQVIGTMSPNTLVSWIADLYLTEGNERAIELVTKALEAIVGEDEAVKMVNES